MQDLKLLVIQKTINSNERKAMISIFKKSGVRLSLALAVASLVLGCSESTSYYKYSQMVVIGASLSDTGNVFAATGGSKPGPSPYYYEGRWSNGPLWIDNVAYELGVKSTRSSAGGTNFAYGGAKTCSITGVTSDVPDMCQQVAMYLGATGGKADSQALYVIDAASVGNNMLAVLGSAGAVPNSAVTETAPNDVINMMQNLYNAGARRFLVTNSPNVGATPYVKSLGASAAAGAAALSNGFNSVLSAKLTSFSANNSGSNVRLVDFYTAGSNLSSFSNTQAPCLNPTTFAICESPDAYQYWDPFHPTAASGRIMSNTALSAIAE